MVAAGGVRGTDHAAHFGGVFAGKGFVVFFLRRVCCVVVFVPKRTLTTFSPADSVFIKIRN